MISRLEFFITETFVSFRRHPAMAFAAIVCVAVSLFVAGMAALVVVNTNYLVEQTMGQVRFVVYFHSKPQVLSREESLKAFERIKALPQVEQAEFITREAGFEKMRQGNPAIGDLENPLPDAVSIKARDISEIADLKDQIAGWTDAKGVKLADSIVDAENVTAFLLQLRTTVTRIAPVIFGVLALLSLVIIHHTIELTLYARRREINIMSLVGATPATVSTPFTLEGILYGLLGGGVSLGLTFVAYRMLADWLQRTTQIMLRTDQVFISHGALVMLGIGAVLGLIGSIVSVTKYLHNPRSKVTNA